jgi:hypothetical protein
VVTAAVLTWWALVACGGLPTVPDRQPPAVLLSTSLPLTAGQNCSTGGNSATFTPMAGRPITINAQGTGGVNPALTLYAPDFATQLASALGTAGRATLVFTITQSGNHHISVCDQTGTGGTVGITITQQG